MNGLSKTPLFSIYEKYGGKVIDFAGWALPVQFSGIKEEHKAVRKAAGLFDVSHMGEVEVKGKDAEKFMQMLVTNDAEKLVEEQIMYCLMCNPDGGVVDDLIVYKFSSEHYFLVINASNIEKDLAWMQKQKAKYEVSIKNLSDDYAQLAVQGPKAEEILQEITDFDLSKLKFFYCKRDVVVRGIKCLISRSGYTGEDGFELYIASGDAVKLWESIVEIGKEKGLLPCGLGCRDTLRFEASLPLYGNELSDTITPLEAGLGIFVKLDKKDFIGKDALVKQKEEGLERKLVGFEMLERGIPRHGYEVYGEEEKIGWVTTGYLSPSLEKNIGLAIVDIGYAELESEFYIKIRNKMVKAKVVSKRFLNKNYKK